jgi:hypothetical protein
VTERAAAIVAHMRRSIGARGVVEALLYPVLTPIHVALAWLRSLWTARVLLRGHWGRYRGFHPVNALTSFFYLTQWLNLSRYGRHGRSPVVGLGDYPLSRWFHLSRLSSWAYAKAGAVCTLGGTLAWVLSHLMWLGAAPAAWVLAVVAVFFFSSTAYAMAFTRQNYNILGWMWLPLALWAGAQGHWVPAAFVWFAASLASITVVAAAVPLMTVQALMLVSPAPLVALLPALLKVASHLRGQRGRATGGALAAAMGVMGRIIGVVRRGVRYRRTSMGLRPFSAYFIVLYALACTIVTLTQGVPVLPLAALAVFIVNQAWVRFADEQSVIVLFTTVLAAHVLAAPPSWVALLALLLAVNPLPVFLTLCEPALDRSVVRVRTRPPFDHGDLQAAVAGFVAPVPAGARIHFAFADPLGVYENVFDGYRTLLELPLYVCAERGVHLFPDWHAVAETNHPDAPEFWGREPEQVLHHARSWAAAYAIVYTDAGEPLARRWGEAGFVPLARLDWSDWAGALDGHKLWRSAKPPCWHLLAVPPQSAAPEQENVPA